MVPSNKTVAENLPTSTTPLSPLLNNSASTPSGSPASTAKPPPATTPLCNFLPTIPTFSRASPAAPTPSATTTMSAPTTPSIPPSGSTSSKLSSPVPKNRTSAFLSISSPTTSPAVTPPSSIPNAISEKTTKAPNSFRGTTSTT